MIVRNAFTLIEILVCIAIVAILLALSVPLGQRGLQRMTETRCAVNIRSAGTLLGLYTTENRGTFPYAGTEPIIEPGPGGGPDYARGSVLGFEQSWATLLPDDWSGQHWNEALRCPKQPRYEAGATGGPGDLIPDGTLQMPTYFMSRAAWIDPKSLSPDATDKDYLIRPVREEEVAFPSLKALMHEMVPYCVPEARGNIRTIFQSFSFPISIAAHDGSVLRAPRDSFDAGGRYQLVYTPWGVRGRDFVPLN